jgi:beta-xylosidase
VEGGGRDGWETATLWSQRLSPDGQQLVGDPSRLLQADQPWERQTIEGPSMVAGSGGYHLFYSAGAWSSAGYAVGHARCATPAGPCTKSADRPLLSSSGAIAGPGGQEVLRDEAGGLHLVFHAWAASDVGYPNKRSLHVVHLAFAGDAPVISR